MENSMSNQPTISPPSTDLSAVRQVTDMSLLL